MEKLAVTAEFWRGKRVLVTGHTGFKGGWLSLWLQQLGAQVTGYSLAPPTEPNLYGVARVGEHMASVIADVRDVDQVRAAMMKAQPQIVLHLAAQPLVRQSYAEPVNTYATNVMGTVHVLQAIADVKGVRAAVMVTTDKCYENLERPQGYREDDRLGGHDPYSNSKACAELVTQSYRDSFFSPARHREHGVGVATARAGNVIGGGDWAKDRLLPDALRALAQNEVLRIRNPRATRPWQHVLEPLSSYLALAEALWHDGPRYAQAWNFGPAEEGAREVGWVVEEFQRQSGLPLRWDTDAGEHPHEAQLLQLDCSKAREQLHWRPRWNVATALKETALWHQDHSAGRDMRAQTLAQIQTYMQTPMP